MEEFKANAEDTSISSWAEREGDERVFEVMFRYNSLCMYVADFTSLDDIRQHINYIESVREIQGSLNSVWSAEKVRILKAELLRRKNQEILDSKRKDLTSQIEKLQKELKDLK